MPTDESVPPLHRPATPSERPGIKLMVPSAKAADATPGGVPPMFAVPQRPDPAGGYQTRAEQPLG